MGDELTYPLIFIRPAQGDTASRPGRWPCEPDFESEPSRSAWWCSFVAPSHAMTKPAPTKCPCTEACRVHTRNEGIAEGLPTPSRARLRRPRFDRLSGEPDRQAPALAQAGVVLAPVRYLVL